MTNPPPAADATPTPTRAFNKGDMLRQIRRRMRYLERKVAANDADTSAERGEWQALRWAVSIVVEKYPDLRRAEDDEPVPAHMEQPRCRPPAAPK